MSKELSGSGQLVRAKSETSETQYATENDFVARFSLWLAPLSNIATSAVHTRNIMLLVVMGLLGKVVVLVGGGEIGRNSPWELRALRVCVNGYFFILLKCNVVE